MNYVYTRTPSKVIADAIDDVRSIMAPQWDKADAERLFALLITRLEAAYTFVEGHSKLPAGASAIIRNVIRGNRRHAHGKLSSSVTDWLESTITDRLSKSYQLVPRQYDDPVVHP